MKKWYNTSESWMTIITAIMGMVVTMTSLTSAEGQEIVGSVQTLIGAIMTICAVLGYTKSRTDIKRARIEALDNWTESTGKETAKEKTDKYMVKIKAIEKLGI